MSYDNLVILEDLNIFQKENRKLMSSLIVPSASHSYALAIEYVQKWFLSKFSKDFFKNVYIEGKHIFDESRRFNINQTARRENPAVSITPVIDFDFDRDKLDLSLGGLEIYEQRHVKEGCFFKDFNNGIFIKEAEQLNVLNFTIRVYVDTRAKQLNLWHYMKLAFRVGASQGEYIDMDFSLPQDLILQLAHDTGFEVDCENKKVKNVVGFLNYLNQNSIIPFLYKLRCENGRDEFFIRVPQQYIHIAIPDYLSVDDGDRVGHVYQNFPIEMNLTLRFPAPQTFIYLSKHPQTILEGVKMEESADIAGLYSIKILDVPLVNEQKWNLYMQSEYLEDEPSKNITMDFNALFDINIKEVLKYTLDQYISPKIFLDIKLFDIDGQLIPFKVNWETLEVEIKSKEKEYQKLIIAIYVDTKYLNETIVTMKHSADNRLDSSKIQQ